MLAASTTSPPTTPPAIAPVFVEPLRPPVKTGSDVGVEMTVWVTILPLSVIILMLVCGAGTIVSTSSELDVAVVRRVVGAAVSDDISLYSKLATSTKEYKASEGTRKGDKIQESM